MQANLDLDLDSDLRRIVREELVAAASEPVDAWLDTAQAAAHLALTEHAIRGLVKRRQVPFTKFPNGKVRFVRSALEAWARGDAA